MHALHTQTYIYINKKKIKFSLPMCFVLWWTLTNVRMYLHQENRSKNIKFPKFSHPRTLIDLLQANCEIMEDAKWCNPTPKKQKRANAVMVVEVFQCNHYSLFDFNLDLFILNNRFGFNCFPLIFYKLLWSCKKFYGHVKKIFKLKENC